MEQLCEETDPEREKGLAHKVTQTSRQNYHYLLCPLHLPTKQNVLLRQPDIVTLHFLQLDLLFSEKRTARMEEFSREERKSNLWQTTGRGQKRTPSAVNKVNFRQLQSHILDHRVKDSLSNILTVYPC